MATIQEISEQIKQAGLDAGQKTLDILNGGEADNISDDKFNPEALAQGIKHEMEHSKDEAVAKEIAKDHLLEDEKYYDKLEAAKLCAVDQEIIQLMAAK